MHSLEEFVWVQVQNPLIHKTSKDGFVVTYDVLLETNSLSFTKKNSLVRRKYSDFLWLRKALEETAGTRPSPSLPRERIFWKNDEEYLRKNGDILTSFMQEIVKKTVFLASAPLHLFLQTTLATPEMNLLSGELRRRGSMNAIVRANLLTEEKASKRCEKSTAFVQFINKLKHFPPIFVRSKRVNLVHSFSGPSIFESEDEKCKILTKIDEENFADNGKVFFNEDGWVWIDHDLYCPHQSSRNNSLSEKKQQKSNTEIFWSGQTCLNSSHAYQRSKFSEYPRNISSLKLTSDKNLTLVKKKFNEKDANVKLFIGSNQPRQNEQKHSNYFTCSNCSEKLTCDEKPKRCETCRCPFFNAENLEKKSKTTVLPFLTVLFPSSDALKADSHNKADTRDSYVAIENKQEEQLQ